MYHDVPASCRTQPLAGRVLVGFEPFRPGPPRHCCGKLPLIGVGGISSAEDAYMKIRAGATLVQLYTALVYQGFGMVKRMQEDLLALLKKDGFSHIRQATGIDNR